MMRDRRFVLGRHWRTQGDPPQGEVALMTSRYNYWLTPQERKNNGWTVPYQDLRQLLLASRRTSKPFYSWLKDSNRPYAA